MKKILLIGMGGTIASMATGSGLAPELSAEELLKYVPELSNICNVDSTNLCSIDSTNMTPSYWIAAARCIKDKYELYDGFVITHGTDTMAYSSAALSYLVQNSAKPIVFTGAQKPIHMDYTDSKLNLKDAFICACSDDICGVHIVFNGKVILGTRARKTHSKSFYAFSSINYPYVAVIQDSYMLNYIGSKPCGAPKFSTKLEERVAVLKLIPNTDAEVLRFLLDRNRALIIESFGVGGLPTYENADFAKIVSDYTAKGKIVIMTSQVENEGSDLGVYHVGRSLTKRDGVYEAYDMTTESVIAKTMWILAHEDGEKNFKHMFYAPISKDILYTGK